MISANFHFMKKYGINGVETREFTKSYSINLQNLGFEVERYKVTENSNARVSRLKKVRNNTPSDWRQYFIRTHFMKKFSLTVMLGSSILCCWKIITLKIILSVIVLSSFMTKMFFLLETKIYLPNGFIWLTGHLQADTRRLTNVGLTFVHRLQLWTNANLTLIQRWSTTLEWTNKGLINSKEKHDSKNSDLLIIYKNIIRFLKSIIRFLESVLRN